MALRISIAYFHRDRALAAALTDVLKSDGYEAGGVHFLKGNTSPREQLIGAMRSLSHGADFFVLLLSSGWGASSREREVVPAALADWRGDNLAFVRVGDAEMPSGAGGLTLELADPDRLDVIKSVALWIGRAATQMRVPPYLDPVARLERTLSKPQVTVAIRDVRGARRAKRRILLASGIMAGLLLGLVAVYLLGGVLDPLGPTTVELFGKELPVEGIDIAIFLISFVVLILTMRGLLFALGWLRRALSRHGLRRRVQAAARAEAKAAEIHHEVFISYSRRDEEIVAELHRELTDAGITVWRDLTADPPEMPSALTPETPARFGRRIVEAIVASRVVILMGSASAFASHHVMREVYVAGGRNKPFVWVRLDTSDPPGDFEYHLAGFPRLPEGDAPPPATPGFAAAFQSVCRFG